MATSARAAIPAVYGAGADEAPLPTTGRYRAYASFGLAGLALLAVIAFGVWERYFTVAALAATIEAPVVGFAPRFSRFVSALEPASASSKAPRLAGHSLDGATPTRGVPATAGCSTNSV